MHKKHDLLNLYGVWDSVVRGKDDSESVTTRNAFGDMFVITVKNLKYLMTKLAQQIKELGK